MREYIVNLTNNLIGKHGFDLVYESMKGRGDILGVKEEFVRLVNITIGSNDVRSMSPETLGKIVCSLEGSELPGYNPGLFMGDPAEFLRGITSSFLAWSIRYRLDPDALARHSKIPPYKKDLSDPRFGPALKEFEFTVPTDYHHDTQIDTFAAKTKLLPTTYYFNNNLTSSNFAKATNKLEPGKTYRVKIFPILSRVSSEDCMTFLEKQNGILVGGQGITLLQDNKPDEFPVGKYTVSLDKKEALWKDSDGDLRVPFVYRGSDGGWGFRLDGFESGWNGYVCLVCFCDL